MKKAFIFLAEGFEEIEAVGTIDVLRRAGIDTTTVSTVYDEFGVEGAHNIYIATDSAFESLDEDEIDFTEADILILPGGMPGSNNLNAYGPLKAILKEHHAEGKWIAAICAAPLILGGMGMLKGRKATCYPGFENTLKGATVTDEPVVVDGNIITGKGPGFVFDFALAIVEALKGKAAADEVAKGMLLK